MNSRWPLRYKNGAFSAGTRRTGVLIIVRAAERGGRLT